MIHLRNASFNFDPIVRNAVGIFQLILRVLFYDNALFFVLYMIHFPFRLMPS